MKATFPSPAARRVHRDHLAREPPRDGRRGLVRRDGPLRLDARGLHRLAGLGGDRARDLVVALGQEHRRALEDLGALVGGQRLGHRALGGVDRRACERRVGARHATDDVARVGRADRPATRRPPPTRRPTRSLRSAAVAAMRLFKHAQGRLPPRDGGREGSASSGSARWAPASRRFVPRRGSRPWASRSAPSSASRARERIALLPRPRRSRRGGSPPRSATPLSPGSDFHRPGRAGGLRPRDRGDRRGPGREARPLPRARRDRRARTPCSRRTRRRSP